MGTISDSVFPRQTDINTRDIERRCIGVDWARKAPMGDNEIVEAVWRMESARIIAGLTCVVGHVGHAKDVAQDDGLELIARLEGEKALER